MLIMEFSMKSIKVLSALAGKSTNIVCSMKEVSSTSEAVAHLCLEVDWLPVYTRLLQIQNSMPLLPLQNVAQLNSDVSPVSRAYIQRNHYEENKTAPSVRLHPCQSRPLPLVWNKNMDFLAVLNRTLSLLRTVHCDAHSII